MIVVLSKTAGKQYGSLPRSGQVKVRKKLVLLEQNPLAGKKLCGDFRGTRSLRAWPFRIIYELNESNETVDILKISHRQGVYK